MKNRSAFTFTETLVLASVGFLLIGAALPSLDGAKQELQASQCLSNMREWGLAMGMYCNDYHDYMPYEGNFASPISEGQNLNGWYDVLPHYVNQTSLKDLYTSVPPGIPVPGMRSIYICPSAPAVTNYTPSTSQPYFGYAMNRVLTGTLTACPNNLYRRSIAALPGQVIDRKSVV